jgi:hypothetical protein
MSLEPKTQFKDPAAAVVWAGICALEEGAQHDVLDALTERLLAPEERPTGEQVRTARGMESLRRMGSHRLRRRGEFNRSSGSLSQCARRVWSLPSKAVLHSESSAPALARPQPRHQPRRPLDQLPPIIARPHGDEFRDARRAKGLDDSLERIRLSPRIQG